MDARLGNTLERLDTTSESTWDDAVVIGRDDVLEFNQDNILPQPAATVARIRAWLEPTDYRGEGSEYKKHISSYLPGTGKWFLASDPYRQWHDGGEYGLLWARGIPGSGKSVLAASLINQLSQESVPVLYFFFRKIIDANHNPDAALRDWLVQILPFSPPLQLQLKSLLGIVDALESRPRKTRRLESLAISDLWHHLRAALAHLPRAYIVVDALDEMNQGPEMDAFLQTLTKLSQWRPSRLKVLITSRPVSSVERALRLEKVLRLKLEEHMVDLDIAAYVKYRLDTSSISSGEHQPIQSAVPGNANGLFLYAKLAMDAFLQEGADTQKVLQQLPLNLDIMYSRLLQDHARKTGTPQEMQLLILQWATHSVRPLRLLEVADLINVTSPSKSRDLKATKDLVRAACGPLLEILPDETLCVVHHSLTEFLIGQTRASLDQCSAATKSGFGPDEQLEGALEQNIQSQVQYHHTDNVEFKPILYPVLEAATTHNRLAILCLSYLQSGCLDSISDTQPRMNNPFGEKPERPLLAPFTMYAATNWDTHARKASSAGIDSSELNTMLDKFMAREDYRKWARLTKFESSDNVSPLYLAISLGLTEYLKVLLGRSDTNVKEGAPICYAAAKGFSEVVELLLYHGADPSPYNDAGATPLHLASKNNHPKVISLLLQSGCDPFLLDKPKRERLSWGAARVKTAAMQYACSYGHIEATVAFLPYIKTAEQFSQVLTWAVDSQKADIVEKVLEHPLRNMNKFDSWESPLYTACSKRDLPTIKLVLAAGADPNYLHEDPGSWNLPGRGQSALQALTKTDDWARSLPSPRNSDPEVAKECFKLLLSSGANVHQADNYGNTPLHYAADEVAASMLLDAGANIRATNEWSETPLHTCKNSNVLRLLIRVGNADIEHRNCRGETPLLSALNDNCTSLEKALTLLDLGASTSAVDKDGNGAIHLAFGIYSLDEPGEELIRRLYEAGADINLKNQKGQAPIHIAKVDVSSKESAFCALVALGADLTLRDDTGRTPPFQWISDYHWGTDRQMMQVFDMVTKHGATLDTTDDRGRTLLHAAVRSGPHPTALVDYLVQHGLDPKRTDSDGNTLWHEVAQNSSGRSFDRNEGPPAIFAELFRLGVNPQRPNNHGRTALHVLSTRQIDSLHDYKRSSRGTIGAGHAGKTTAFDYLMSYQSNIDQADQDGVTALHLCSTFSEYQTTRLLASGATATLSTHEGLTALHLAARSRQPNIIGLLMDALQTSSDSLSLAVNAKDSKNRTPLYYACASGLYESAKMLIEAGAGLDFVDYESSPWMACATYEQEMNNWLDYDSHDREAPASGGVLLSDKYRSHKGIGYHRISRLGELLELLVSVKTPPLEFVDRAINKAAACESEYMIECLLNVRKQLDPGDMNLAPPVMEILARRKAERDAEREESENPCKNCKRIHNRTVRRSIVTFKEYHRLPEAVSPEDRLNLTSNSYKTVSNIRQLVSHGLASILSETVTLEDIQKLEDPSWYNSQEAVLDPTNRRNIKLSMQPLLLTACRRDVPNMDVIRVLVDQLKVNLNAQDLHDRPPDYSGYSNIESEGECPLHALARGEHWWNAAEGLPYLLKHGANTEIRDAHGMTPLSAALERMGWLVSTVSTRRAIELLVKHGADVNSIDNAGNSCLAKACLDVEVTKLLLDHGATVTPDVLIETIKKRDFDLLVLLLSRGADVNVRGVSRYKKSASNSDIFSDEMYPLHYLAQIDRSKDPTEREEHQKWIQLFLDHGANLSAPYEGTTIMHELIGHGFFVDPFLTKPMPTLDLEIRDSTGATAILAACIPKVGRHMRGDNRSVIDLLISRGANVRAVDNSGKNMLHGLIERVSMFSAFEDVKLVVASAPELINQPDNAGNTPLHLGVGEYKYSSKEVDMFLSAGGDIHALDGDGNSLLHLLLKGTWEVTVDGMVKDSLLKVFHRLLSMGANINARNKAGETPVFYLFRHGNVDVDKPSGQSDTTNPARSGKPRGPKIWEEPVYEVLTRAGVNWKAINDFGQNLLHVAAVVNDQSYPGRAAKRFKALVGMGLDSGLEDQSQRTPVDIAAELKNQEVLALFRDK